MVSSKIITGHEKDKSSVRCKCTWKFSEKLKRKEPRCAEIDVWCSVDGKQ
jgi:hypothetical protein